MKRPYILNVRFDNLRLDELLERLQHGGVVFTPNVDHLMKLQRDRDFYRVYRSADYRVCDSQILMLVARWLGSPLVEKISGSDLFPAFYRYYRRDESVRIFLLGAAEGVADRARDRINRLVGREMVVGAYSPPFGFEHDLEECAQIIQRIQDSGATVLAVGLGAPKQELWIDRYRHALPGVRTILAIGATLDFEAGQVSRSPRWMSQVGLEWLYRLLMEPRRLWRRYLLEDLPFFRLALKQALGRYHNPFPEVDLLPAGSSELRANRVPSPPSQTLATPSLMK